MKASHRGDRPAQKRPRTHADEVGATTPQPEHAEGVAPVCPLIPGRFKYTCSGRCKGCNERHDHAGPASNRSGSVY